MRRTFILAVALAGLLAPPAQGAEPCTPPAGYRLYQQAGEIVVHRAEVRSQTVYRACSLVSGRATVVGGEGYDGFSGWRTDLVFSGSFIAAFTDESDRYQNTTLTVSVWDVRTGRAYQRSASVALGGISEGTRYRTDATLLGEDGRLVVAYTQGGKSTLLAFAGHERVVAVERAPVALRDVRVEGDTLRWTEDDAPRELVLPPATPYDELGLCRRPAGARVSLVSPRLILYARTTRSRRVKRTNVFACAAEVGRLHLFMSSFERPGSSAMGMNVAVNGTFVAGMDRLLRKGRQAYRLSVRDAATGAGMRDVVLHESRAGTGIYSMQVGPLGHVVWNQDTPRGGQAVMAAAGREIIRVTATRPAQATYARIEGDDEVSWIQDGTSRRRQLPPVRW